MDRTAIVIDVEDDEICAYDEGNDVIWKNYSSIELSSLLEEIPKLSFDKINVSFDNQSISCIYGDEELVFRNLDRLKSIKDFSIVFNHLEKEEERLIGKKQLDKLKQRKSKKVTRIAAFTLATMLAFPSGFGVNALGDNVLNNVSYNEIIDDEYSLGELDTMVLQGVCTVGENTFITAYDSSWRMRNSVVYVLDNNNECIKKVKLYNNSHVGGICYDSEHEMFWITDKGGTISGYTYDSIFYDSKDKVQPKYKKVDVGSKDLINYKGWPSAAYITYHDGKLFLGNFSINGKGVLKSFELNENGSVDLSSCKKAKFIDKVQGISFYNKDGQEYLLVSTSYGQKASSSLKIFKYDEECLDYSGLSSIQMEMPPMMEQITFDKDGKLISVFESNAVKFKKVKNHSSDVVVTNIEPVVENGRFKVL